MLHSLGRCLLTNKAFGVTVLSIEAVHTKRAKRTNAETILIVGSQVYLDLISMMPIEPRVPIDFQAFELIALSLACTDRYWY